MVLLIISSLLLFVAYMAYALRAIKDIPWSISDTYYQLEKRIPLICMEICVDFPIVRVSF